MLSGIGDPAQLEALGIKVNVPLPGVGANLTDHPGTSLAFGLRLPGTSRPTTNHAEGGLFMKSSTLESGFEADLQFFAVPFAPFLIAATTQSQMMGIAAQACAVLSAAHALSIQDAADAASAAAADRALLAAIDEAAERLGNTRTVCRNSYLHPAVPRAHLEGAVLEAWRASRSTPRMSRAERATLRVLQEQALT